MPTYELPEIPGEAHPINMWVYKPHTVPATEIEMWEAAGWAKALQETHRQEAAVIPLPNVLHPNGEYKVSQMISMTEGNMRSRLYAGKTIVGPAVVGGEVLVAGIGFWAPLEDKPAEA